MILCGSHCLLLGSEWYEVPNGKMIDHNFYE